jgi:predicted nucleic acid-binding protein
VSEYLLDTNILSEARKRQKANPGLSAWFATVGENELFLSVLVLGEIRKGIEQARKSDRVKVGALERWLEGLEETYADRIFPITDRIADRWGRLSALHPVSTVDGLLAATALVHDLTLVTRNVRDISRTGVRFLNPFDN